jgi:hypothetical protein
VLQDTVDVLIRDTGVRFVAVAREYRARSSAVDEHAHGGQHQHQHGQSEGPH